MYGIAIDAGVSSPESKKELNNPEVVRTPEEMAQLEFIELLISGKKRETELVLSDSDGVDSELLDQKELEHKRDQEKEVFEKKFAANKAIRRGFEDQHDQAEAQSKEQFSKEWKRALSEDDAVPSKLVCPVSLVALDKGEKIVFSRSTGQVLIADPSEQKSEEKQKDEVDASLVLTTITKDVRELVKLFEERLKRVEEEYAHGNELVEDKFHAEIELFKKEIAEHSRHIAQIKEKNSFEIKSAEESVRHRISLLCKDQQSELESLKAQISALQMEVNGIPEQKHRLPVAEIISSETIKQRFLFAVKMNNRSEVLRILKAHSLEIDASTINKAFDHVLGAQHRGVDCSAIFSAVESHKIMLEKQQALMVDVAKGKVGEQKQLLQVQSFDQLHVEEEQVLQEMKKESFDQFEFKLHIKTDGDMLNDLACPVDLVCFDQVDSCFSPTTQKVFSRDLFNRLFREVGEAKCPVTQMGIKKSDFIDATNVFGSIAEEVRQLFDLFNKRLAELEKEHQARVDIMTKPLAAKKAEFESEKLQHLQQLEKELIVTKAKMEAEAEKVIQQMIVEHAKVIEALQAEKTKVKAVLKKDKKKEELGLRRKEKDEPTIAQKRAAARLFKPVADKQQAVPTTSFGNVLGRFISGMIFYR